ncbi:hypothetical protein A3709_02160 [Halioglobus sp. HI00S01]|uniref:carotenoid oxygenase family protein n=1 Tax=Halioglobus sp. HI00S01 TaxID=1822214 RepID=UPI0007C269F9|nr:carotenoid oxygenase family protein [Halioglobus sp. HI00S01]KZX58289.1 hypothetical protein A3709_02160 [Halioglobus sp. HI00S01]
MSPTLTTLVIIVFGLLIARRFLAPVLVGRWIARLRADPAIDEYNAASAYSQRGFDPVHTELGRVALPIQGELPPDLQGAYLRNGTNRQVQDSRSRLHMFNGAGMLHQIQFRDGQAWYSNTFVRTPRFEHERAAGHELYPEFGDIAGNGKKGFARIISSAMAQRFGLAPKMSNETSASSTTAIQYHHGKLYALQETAHPFALETRMENGHLIISGKGAFDEFDGVLTGPFTAHPKIDPASGDWHSFSTHLQSGKIFYSVLAAGQLKFYREIAEAKPALAFVHDGFLTPNAAVFPDLSLRFDGGQMFKEHASPFYYDPDYEMRFGVIDRNDPEHAEVHWCDTGMDGHIWHTVNGWEEARADGGADLVLVAPVFRAYPSNVPIHLPQEPHAHLYKFRFDLATGERRDSRCLLEHFYERPSFNTAWIGKQTRYAYLLDEEGAGGVMASGVLKYDMIDEQAVGEFSYGDYRGGEALFVPREGATEEDDGYLIELLMADEDAALLVLDARNMTELARLPLPQRVPYGVHGCWLDASQLETLA